EASSLENSCTTLYWLAELYQTSTNFFPMGDVGPLRDIVIEDVQGVALLATTVQSYWLGGNHLRRERIGQCIREILLLPSRDHLVIVQDFDIGIIFHLCAIIDEDIPYVRVGGNVSELDLTLSLRTRCKIILTQVIIPDLNTAFEGDLNPEEKAEQDQRKRENKKVHIHKGQLNKGVLLKAFSIRLSKVTLPRDIETKLGTIITTLPTKELASLRDVVVSDERIERERLVSATKTVVELRGTLERATKLGEKIAASCGQTRKLDIKPLTVEEWNTLRTALVATLSNHSRPTNDTPVNFAEDKITMDDSEYSRLILFEPIFEKEA
ncbi:hypothetical protein PROFUN_16810, partial [Planoprotostelium fungivorum]